MKSELPLVSIGVPVYNEERFLEETLTSLLAQDYPNIEIILSDNASTDRTADICQQIAAQNPSVTFHRFDENRGAPENFQYVLDHSSGTYFMWAAGHDLWSPNTISECVNMLEGIPESAIAIGSSQWIDENGDTMTLVSGWTDTRGMHPVARFFSVFWGNMHPVLGLIRKSYLEELGQFRPFAGADLVLLSELSLRGDFLHAANATWKRREFRHEQSHADKLKRYRSAEYGLAGSFLDRYFPLLRLPLALIKVVFKSTLPIIQKIALLFALLTTFPLRYLVGKR
jgi:glycosyltransferase involved in cell wall biosynthesis